MPHQLIGHGHHIGARSEQQDSLTSQDIPNLGQVFVACDGMGGTKGGAMASSSAIKIIIDSLTKSVVNDPRQALENAIQFANGQIYDYAQRNQTYKNMGTTVTALLLCPEHAVVCNVGDSRTYQVRKGRKIFRTTDHSKIFEEMVLTGLMTEEQARTADNRNVITRALGVLPKVHIDTYILSYEKGDLFVLCSDGVWEAMPEEHLLSMFSQKKNPALADTIINHIIGLGKPGQDNMALLVARCSSYSKLEPVWDMKTKILIGALAILALMNLPSWYISYQQSQEIKKYETGTTEPKGETTRGQNPTKSEQDTESTPSQNPQPGTNGSDSTQTEAMPSPPENTRGEGSTSKSHGYIEHKVKKGENLFRITMKYNTKMDAIKKKQHHQPKLHKSWADYQNTNKQKALTSQNL